MSQPDARWWAVDDWVMCCLPSAKVASSVEELAAHLTEPFQATVDKHRAIFRWLTENIAYDIIGKRDGTAGDQGPSAVLSKRRSVCQGYADLWKALAVQSPPPPTLFIVCVMGRRNL